MLLVASHNKQHFFHVLNNRFAIDFSGSGVQSCTNEGRSTNEVCDLETFNLGIYMNKSAKVSRIKKNIDLIKYLNIIRARKAVSITCKDNGALTTNPLFLLIR